MSDVEKKPEVPPTEAPAPQEGGEKKEKKKGPTKAELKAQRQAEKEAAAKAEAEAKAAKLLTLAPEIFGKKPVIASTTNKSLKLTNFNELADNVEKTVTVRARIHGSRKQGGKMAFLTLRQFGTTCQALIYATGEEGCLPKEMVGWAVGVPNESIIDIEAVVKVPENPIDSCTLKNVELAVSKMHIVSQAAPVLPFQLADASRRVVEEQEGEKKDEKKKADIVVEQNTRLNNRWLDLRTPASNAIFKVQSRVCQYFREYLLTQDFCEIHTPKIIGAASEGGANVFKLGYFGKDAYLAQSPQLYKQMVVQGDLPRVFEVGSVFRAENANTHRHLTEFIGLDIEMAINEHYYEVLDVAEELFAYMFSRLGALPELEAINEQHPFNPFVYNVSEEIVDELKIGILEEGIESADPYCGTIRNRKTGVLRMPLPKAIELLNANVPADKQLPLNEDMNTESEKKLGVIMKERYGVDFYILDHFPASARPFYTMPDQKNPEETNSFDMFMRGEEISSGAQRIHDPEMLLANAQRLNVDMGPLKDYVDSFRLGAWPHGGFGVGMERVVMLYLGLKNVRYTSLFPRDPARVTP